MKSPSSNLDEKELSDLFNDSNLLNSVYKERQKLREKRNKHHSPTDKKNATLKRLIHNKHRNPPQKIYMLFPDDVNKELNEHSQMRNDMYLQGNRVPSQMIPIPTSNSERSEYYLPYSKRKAGKKTRNNRKKSRKTRSKKIRGSKKKIRRK